MSASSQRVCEIPSRISVFLLNVSLFSESLSRSTLPSATSVAQPASPEPQSLPSFEADLDRNSAKSPGSAVLCRDGPRVWPVWCESREVGSSPKLCQTFYRRRTEVWGMDLSEVGAEFGSCCHSAWAILIEILQNRQEMLLSAKDRKEIVATTTLPMTARRKVPGKGRKAKST